MCGLKKTERESEREKSERVINTDFERRRVCRFVSSGKTERLTRGGREQKKRIK